MKKPATSDSSFDPRIIILRLRQEVLDALDIAKLVQQLQVILANLLHDNLIIYEILESIY